MHGGFYFRPDRGSMVEMFWRSRSVHERDGGKGFKVASKSNQVYELARKSVTELERGFYAEDVLG